MHLPDKFSKHRLLTSSKCYPSSIFCSFSSPMGSHQQAACNSQWNDSHDDKKQCGDPLWRKPRWDACPVSSMDCLTLSHKAHSECSCGEAKVGNILVGLAYPGNIPYQYSFSPSVLFLCVWVIQALNSTESYSSALCCSSQCSNTWLNLQSELKKKTKTTKLFSEYLYQVLF